MFNNIGSKIKIYAEVMSWLGIITCVLIGVISMISGIANSDVGAFFTGLLVALLGSLLCWISAFFFYGFGKLVENSDILVNDLAPNHQATAANDDAPPVIHEYELNTWEDKIHILSNGELEERIQSNEWEAEYKALCKEELKKRAKNNI